ncbi:hypothetical protein DFS34DRAFT_597886 [Phlyctochytrium arcticum]|nr:hypothetical protein DFS34DRAFT_597886 [Phlyctochytrium arcticum]
MHRFFTSTINKTAAITDVADLKLGQLYRTSCSLKRLETSLSDILSIPSSIHPLRQPLLASDTREHKKQITVVLLDIWDNTLQLVPVTTWGGRLIDDDDTFLPGEDKEKIRRLLKPASPMNSPEYTIVDPETNPYNPPVQYISLMRYECEFRPNVFFPVVADDSNNRISYLDNKGLARYLPESWAATVWLRGRGKTEDEDEQTNAVGELEPESELDGDEMDSSDGDSWDFVQALMDAYVAKATRASYERARIECWRQSVTAGRPSWGN